MNEINDTMLALNEECSRLERELEACQALKKELRDRLVYVDAYLEAEGGFENLREDIAIELSMPTDDTALRERLKAERDRCVTELLSRHANGNYKHDTRDDCIFAILALGDTE